MTDEYLEKNMEAEKNIKRMTCIICPMGCALEVSGSADGVTVTGNNCRRGVEYAIKELSFPSRTLTCTVSVMKGRRPLVSAKTNGEIPKDMLLPGMEFVRRLSVEAPVKAGQILVRDFLSTGSDLISCEEVEKLGE